MSEEVLQDEAFFQGGPLGAFVDARAIARRRTAVALLVAEHFARQARDIPEATAALANTLIARAERREADQFNRAEGYAETLRAIVEIAKRNGFSHELGFVHLPEWMERDVMREAAIVARVEAVEAGMKAAVERVRQAEQRAEKAEARVVVDGDPKSRDPDRVGPA